MDDSLRKKLDEAALITVRRKWSPVQTEECPVIDLLHGGFCESDEQLRSRLKSGE